MEVPTYQHFMEPCLQILSNRDLVSKKKIISEVSDSVGLTREQRSALLESGRSTIVESRISWALAYMKQAGLIENPIRGSYRITERGVDVLASAVRPISTALLEKFDEFQDFRRRSLPRSIESESASLTNADVSQLSPEEQLMAAARSIRADVQSQLLSQLKVVDPARFERVVVDVLRALGYGVDGQNSSRVVGKTGDEGIDGVIDQDLLGLDSIYIQAKRWQGTVGRPEVQGFAGALQGQKATKGVMITTSTFTENAKAYVASLANSRIVLVDGIKLAGLMYDYGVGVSNSTSVTVRQLDTDYFSTDE
ncbi:MAG: restriction endonuclease [Pseudomonadales bacterium]